MIFRLMTFVSLFCLTSFSCYAEAACNVGDGYYVTHQATAVTATTFSLEDGTTWQTNGIVNALMTQGGPVWIVPVMQEPVWAVFFSFYVNPTTMTLTGGSTTLSISSISGNTVTLSDNSQWGLDPYYQKYTAGWQVGDAITLAGRHNEYYLINGGTVNSSNLNTTYCLVSHISNTTE